jgi:hypothetical protein
MTCLDKLIKKYGHNIFGRKKKKNQDKTYYEI